MKPILKRSVFLALFYFASLAVNATIYYVSTSGNDAGNGSQSSPWKTLKRAFQRNTSGGYITPFASGDVVQVSAGTFIEDAIIYIPTGVSILGSTTGTTAIEAAASLHYFPSNPAFGLASSPEHDPVDRFLFVLRSGSRTNTDNQSLKNLTIRGSGKKLHGGIYVKSRNNVKIEHVQIQETNFCGIWLWDVKEADLVNISTQNCAWGSVDWSSGAIHLTHSEDIEISQLTVVEGPISGRPESPVYWGYGIKAIPNEVNTLKNILLHNFNISVDPRGAWRNGSAPNISVELFAGSLKNVQIYDGVVDNHISIVSHSTPAADESVKIYRNRFNTQGKGYNLELTYSNVEVYENWFNGGDYGIVHWLPNRKCTNWNIHHNTFYMSRPLGANPTGMIITHKNGIEDVIITNNTVEMTGEQTDFIVFDNAADVKVNPTSRNITISRNLIIDSQTSQTRLENRVVRVANGVQLVNVNVSNNWFQDITGDAITGVSYLNNQTGNPLITKTTPRPDPYYRLQPNFPSGMQGIGAYESTSVPVTGISLAPNAATLTTGGTQQLTKTISPANATNQNVTWSTSNANVAAVNSNGLVTALTAGTSNITVTTADGNRTATATITVNANPNVNIIDNAITGAGSNQHNYTGSWTHASTVPTFFQSTLSYSNTLNNTMTFTFTGNKIDWFTEKKHTHGIVAVSIDNGQEELVDLYAATEQQQVVAYSSNPTLAQGNHTFKIRVTGQKNPASTGTYAIHDYLRIHSAVAVTGVTVSPATATLTLGGTNTVQLNATVSPSTATNKTVTWTTSSASVATVNATGLVTAHGPGNATITVTTTDGSRTATSAITVIAPVTGVAVSPTSATLSIGGTQQLTKTITPANATNQNVTWSTSNASIASVNSNGLVTALAAGTATITVTTADGNRIATSAITVNPSAPSGTASYYVGGAGASDSNPGTASQPFETIQKAASMPGTGNVINIRAGTYRETITPAGNGTIFQPDNGAIVVISGLNEAGNSGWTPHGTMGIYKKSITLPVANGFNTSTQGSNTILLANQIFKNGVMQIQSRWPEASTVEELFDKTKMKSLRDTIAFQRTQLTDSLPAANLSGGYVSINGWYLTETRKIKTHTGNTITYDATSKDTVYRKFYYVTGTLSLLTHAKEWHYDPGLLYFWQEGGGSPTGVEFKARNWGFDLTGKSNITITGLHFIGCDPVNANESSTNIIIDGIRAKYTNHGFLSGDDLYHTSKQVGIKLIGANSKIKNSEIAYASSHGIWLGENCRAENNLLHDIAYDGMYGSPISLWESYDGQIITRNTVYRTGRSSFDFGYANHHGKHRNVQVSYNDFSIYGMLSVDLGAIYAARGVDLTGTVVHHNWVHDCAIPDPFAVDGIQTALYFDQAAGPLTLHHNVCWNSGVSDYYAELHVNWPAEQVVLDTKNHLYNNTFTTFDIINGEQPHSYVTYATTPSDVQRNNIYRRDIVIAWQSGTPGDIQYAVRENVDPLFVRTGGGGLNFRIQSNSPAKDAGIHLPGITDGSQGTPDIGAYEFGGEAWVAGYNTQGGSGPIYPPQQPNDDAIIALHFNENSGTAPVSTGTAAMTFTRTSPTPAWSTNTPTTTGGTSSVDFGTTNGNNVVESNDVIGSLKNLSAFTLTGWVNCKSNVVGAGGNRIISWINNGGDGVDLVYNSNGSLQLGIDQWPDGSPAVSSINKVTTNASAPAANWVFFAVTYQSSTNQVEFYFGNNTIDATLDVTRTYNRGPVGSNIARLAIGHFNSMTRSGALDRMFKGLIDEVQIRDAALPLTEIIAIQRASGDTQAPTAPTLALTSKTTNSVALSWSGATDNIGVTSYEIYQSGTFLTSTSSLTYTVINLTPNTAYSFTVKALDAADNISVASNVVTVTTNAAPLIALRFNETTGTTPLNSGTAGGTFSRSAIPAISTNVPLSGGLRAVDFGVTNGDHVVESSGIIEGLKNLNAFTLTGWVNCKSNVVGAGGNRIISWINNGGDGVDLVYHNNGSLQLGIDQWPDASPAVSSLNKVTTNASAPAANWVFFAVTYQSSTNQVQFYFGNNTIDATLDATRTYNRGPVGSNTARLAIGHFNSMTRAGAQDRMFKGLIDEIQVHGSALTLPEIVALQRGTPPSSGARLAKSEEAQDAEQVKVETHFRAYPNPIKSGDVIYLELPGNTGELKITDMVGKPRHTLQITSEKIEIPTNGFSEGIYFIRYRSSNASMSLKLMVE